MPFEADAGHLTGPPGFSFWSASCSTQLFLERLHLLAVEVGIGRFELIGRPVVPSELERLPCIVERRS
jgi:hypothetical protein